jgi:soluble lytic murein transglycosylase-like protein
MALSKKGARGLTQVMPFNAKRCGLRPDQLWDTSFNLACGAIILKQEIKRVGSIEKALRVYNCGKVTCGKGYAKKVLELSKNKR